MAPKKIPNPTDVHVGSRVRMRRTMLSMSQEKLGDQLGITFQQVQKYEKGTNRIGASRLKDIATILEVEPGYFFDDAPVLSPPGANTGFAEAGSSSTYLVDFISSAEGLALNRAFAQIPDNKVRKRVVDLVEAMASSYKAHFLQADEEADKSAQEDRTG